MHWESEPFILEGIGLWSASMEQSVTPAESREDKERIAKLQNELKKKDDKMKIVKWEYNEIKVFYRFPQLAPELRHAVYSKFTLRERAAAVRASPEMAAYFAHHRIKGSAKMSLEEENGTAYVKIQYCDEEYVEMYSIPDELVASVERDLASSRGCRCVYFCDENRYEYEPIEEPVPLIRYFKCSVGDMGMIFDTFALVDLGFFQMKTAQCGGLVDLVQPSGVHPERVGLLDVVLHLEAKDVHKRNNPACVVVNNWGKWLDYLHPEEFWFVSNAGEYVYNSGSEVFLDKNLFDLPAIQNARSVRQECNVNINYNQVDSFKLNTIVELVHNLKLVKMKATTIKLCGRGLKNISALELLEFYKIKIQAWIQEPKTKMCYELNTAEERRNPPYLDHQQLLVNLRDQLKSGAFCVLIYPPNLESKYDSIEIRSMEFRRSLFVTDGSLHTTITKPRRRRV